MTRTNDLLLGKGENGPWSRSNRVTHAGEEIQMEAERVEQRRHRRQTDEARCRSAIRSRRSRLALASVYHLTHPFLSRVLSLSLPFDFITHLIRKVREGRESYVSSGTAPTRRWGRGTSKLVQSYHEGRHVPDDLIIRDCSSAEADGGAAGVACRWGREGLEGGENLSGLPHSGTDLQGWRCFTTPQSAARSLSTRALHIRTRPYVLLVSRMHTRARAREEHVCNRVFVRVQAYKHVILSPRQFHYSELYNADAASRLIRFGREL